MSIATYTRVAVVQLAYHPAILMERRSPLEEPLDDSEEDSLLPASGHVPLSLQDQLKALRGRIRKTYGAQFLAKVRGVLQACRDWKVQLFDDGEGKLKFHQRTEDEQAPWSFTALHMSDGTLRALGILVALFQAKVNSRVRVVGIEEPELALHPGASDLLRDALREGSEYAQVIVTSHSPELLDDPSIQDGQGGAINSSELTCQVLE